MAPICQKTIPWHLFTCLIDRKIGRYIPSVKKSFMRVLYFLCFSFIFIAHFSWACVTLGNYYLKYSFSMYIHLFAL